MDNLLHYLIILLLILSFTISDAQSEDWRWIGENEIGRFFYDKKSITIDTNGMINVNMKQIISTEMLKETEKVLPEIKGTSYLINENVIDCYNGAYTAKRVRYYSNDHVLILDSETDKDKYNEFGFRPIPYNTMIDYLANTVCR